MTTRDGPIITSTPVTQFGLADEVYRYQLTANDPEGDPLVYKLLDAPLGAVIDQETGELLWYPNTSVTAGSTTQFSVQVDDRFGNSDQQTFEVDVVGQLGKIQGVVFSDLNNNGYRDTSLVQGDSPDVVFAIDVSGSTGFRLVDLTTQDISSLDETTASILDLELATTIALSEQLIDQGLGDTAKIGVVLWNTSGQILDMDLAQPGIQLYTTPLADTNNNGIADLREALETVSSGGFTDFTPGLTTAKGVLDSLGGDPNLIFLSDGRGDLDESIVTEINEAGINLTAFGIGAGSSLDQIQKVDPNAIQISNVDELVNIFSGWDPRYSVEPLLENITVYLDHNNNGVLDPDEPYQLTQPDSGNSRLGETRYYYSFENLLPGTYTVRQVVPNGYEETNPSSGSFVDEVTVSGGEVYEHLFGLHPISGPANSNPVFITEAPTTPLQVGEEFIYRALAQDPDADPIRYDLPLAPDGVTIDESGNITWIPQADQVGRFDVILRVRDDQGGTTLQTFALEVESNNQAPTFTSGLDHAQPQVGKAFQYQAKAIDADGDVLTYELVSGPSGVTLDSQTGLLNWTPVSSQLGNRTVQLRALDGQGGEAIQTLDLRVINPLPNQTPTFTSTPRERIRLGNTYFYQVDATDADGDPLTYNLSTAPTGMALQDNILVWTPTADQMGEHQVVLSVDDGQGGVAAQTYTLMVGNQLSNAAPEITSTPNLVTNIEREYQYNLTGSDPDGDLVQWRLVNGPEGVVVDPTSGSLRWQPTVDQLGAHTLIVELSDAYGLSTQQTFEVQVNGANTPPAFLSTPSTRAAQDQAYSYQVIAKDPEQDELTYSLGINPVGMTIDAQSGLIQWTPEASQLGVHDVEVQVRDSQGAVSTQTYRLEVGEAPINQAPTITSRPLFQADLQQPYSYQIEATDPEGGALSYQLLEGPAGITVDAQTGVLTWDAPVVGDHRIVVAAYDVEGLGAAQGYTLRALANELPVIRSTPETTAFVGGEYRYDVQAQDPEGGALTYELDANAQALGVTIDDYGRIFWTPTTDQVGVYPITLTVTDAAGASVEQQFDLTVQTDDVAPEVRLVPSVEPAALGESVSLFASATDNVGVDLLSLTVNGQAVALDANGIYTFTPDAVGDVTAIATARDAAGNTTQTEATFSVLDLTDVDAPEISLPDLSGQVFTAPTEIVGTVNDDNLVYYSLSVAKVGSDDFREIFRGSDPVVDGVLGTFDPSLLENDAYTLRLNAVDAGGNVVTQDEVVTVAGELKLGNFQLSFTDLTIPVTGIPISVTRTYDTLTSNTTDDFGYGWRLEFRDTDLRTSLPKDETFEQLGVRTVGFETDTRVYITLPGGQRQGFTFRPREDNRFNLIAGPTSARLFHPEFVADDGVTSTLTVEDATLVRGAGTDEFFGVNGEAYNPADGGFGGVYTLTTKEEIVYKIDGQSGDLLSVTDTNGNTLTYTDGGIFSDAGPSVLFERNAQGQITRVTDPSGQHITYEYDDLGDLVAVTDREGNTTRFGYDDNRAHYLDEIIDPLGRSGTRSEYNDDGRLSKLIDVNGEALEFIYDPNNSLQEVKDVYGVSTFYEYDQRGNVVSTVDAYGTRVNRDYDEDNNLIRETIISEETGPEGYTTEIVYTDEGQVLSGTNVLNQEFRNTYDSDGNLLTTTNALGQTVTYTYDRYGNPTSVTDAAQRRSEYEVDARGNIVSILNVEQNRSHFEYDVNGNLTRSVDVLGNETLFTYDQNGNRTSRTQTVTKADGSTEEITTTWTYNSNNQLLSLTNAEGAIFSYEYNGSGYLAAFVDALGNRTEYLYDDKDQLVETIYADDTPDDNSDNLRSITLYDRGGRTRAAIDPAGRVTHFVYDLLGRPTEVIYPQGSETLEQLLGAIAPGQTLESVDWADILYPDDPPAYLSDNPRRQWEYFPDGKVKAEIDERGHRVEYRYDELGRLIETILPDETPDTLADNPRLSAEYDAIGQLSQTTDPLGQTTRYVYDDAGQVTQTQFADGTSVSATYNLLGLQTSITDQESNTTLYRYDGLGRLLEIEDALASITRYDYDDVGRRTSTTNALDQVTRYDYDKVGRRTSIELPEGQEASYAYNANGNLETYTDFAGKTQEYDYDALNQLISIAFANDPTQEFTYTATGLIETITDGRGVTQFAYDERDRLIARTDPNGPYISPGGPTIQYTYDDASNRTSVQTPNGTTTYGFDAQNRLNSVIDRDGFETTYRYDLASRLVETVLPNQVIERRDYDDLNRLTHLSTVRRDEVTGEETLITSFEYSLNKIGHRLQVTESTGRVVSYEYDQLYRLTKETISDPNDPTNDGRVTEYELDALGNRLRRIDSLEGETTYTYNQNNQLLREIRRQGDVIEQETVYAYDNNGNLLSKTVNDSEVTTYRWNDENRLVEVELPNGDSISFVYDTAGIQVSRTLNGETTTFIIDSNRPYAQVIESLDDQTLLEFKTFGIDLISQSDENGTIYFHTDGLGSTRAITDANGEVQDRFNYNAFGELLTTENNSDVDNLFAGEQYDAELGLQYLRQRFYDPSTGRFISQDAFEGFLDDPITQNRFLYANANPVTYTDPSGYFSISELNAGKIISNILSKGSAALSATASTAVSRTIAGAATGIFGTALDKIAKGEDITIPDLLLGAGAGASFGYLAPAIAATAPGYAIAGLSLNNARESLVTLHEALNDPNASAIRKTAAFVQALESLFDLKQIVTSGILFGPQCFVAGTPILTPTGKKAIDELEPGDWVLSWDDETDEVTERQVTEWYRREAPAIIDIFIGTEKISCTPEHPFWVPGKEWVLASQIKRGTVLQNRAGEAVVVDAVRRRHEITQVFNVEIDGLHTYFVSNLEILSHNMCQNRQPSPAVPYDDYSPEAVSSRQKQAREYYGQLEEANNSPAGPSGRKKPIPKISGKEGSKDIPSWLKQTGEIPFVGESGKEFAKRVFETYRPGVEYKNVPNSEFNRIKKWADRNFK
ncbi:putative Ig domain-containing protein [Acaryochloris marina]|uniref:putative Ig domain-containing protein n=1 Tax=Acaryochloris marina TaxID=155978 RepID=UPI001BAF30BB|nr:putative Ig domain-containing protein [Acaryochloris marina]QUY46218.1 hypothetical protein I1H34_31355 [Acaryochloris marina S15]